MTMQFACVDGAGHCRLHLTIEAEYDERDLFAERVEVLAPFEPAAVDKFVEQIRELHSSLTGSAVLTLL